MTAIRRACLLALITVAMMAAMGVQGPAISGGPDPRASDPSREVVNDVKTEEAGGAHTYVFTCADGYGFVARTENRTAWLFLPSGTLQLTKDAAAGYRAGKVAFYLKDQESLLEGPEGKHLDCINDRRQAIWQHAKLNGADFRAIGNEPGWSLEIRNQEKIVLVTGYGSERHEFGLPNPETDANARTTRYTVDLPGQEMTLSITGEACQDSMSGEVFTSRVEVLFQGETLRGCGRALH